MPQLCRSCPDSRCYLGSVVAALAVYMHAVQARLSVKYQKGTREHSLQSNSICIELVCTVLLAFAFSNQSYQPVKLRNL